MPGFFLCVSCVDSSSFAIFYQKLSLLLPKPTYSFIRDKQPKKQQPPSTKNYPSSMSDNNKSPQEPPDSLTPLWPTRLASTEQWKKSWLFRFYRGWTPTHAGIIKISWWGSLLNNQDDSWKVSQFSFRVLDDGMKSSPRCATVCGPLCSNFWEIVFRALILWIFIHKWPRYPKKTKNTRNSWVGWLRCWDVGLVGVFCWGRFEDWWCFMIFFS